MLEVVGKSSHFTIVCRELNPLNLNKLDCISSQTLGRMSMKETGVGVTFSDCFPFPPLLPVRSSFLDCLGKSLLAHESDFGMDVEMVI